MIVALPEVFVHLGCLDFLRQWNYKSKRDFTNLAYFQGGKPLIWERTHQCSERFRLPIICWAGTGVLVRHVKHHHTEGQECHLLLDMGTSHDCCGLREDRVERTKDNLWWVGSRDV
jgi:hypothetical protein